MELAMKHENLDSILVRYFAGTLAEAEKDQFEAHYPDCEICAQAIHQALDEREMFDRHALNKLSPGEKEFLEKHYFACQECFEAVQQAEYVITGLRHAKQENVPSPALEKLFPTERLQEFMARFKAIVLSPAFALAVILLLLYPAWRGLKQSGLERELTLLQQPQANAQIYMLEQKRSGEQGQAIKTLQDFAAAPIILQFTLPEKVDAGLRYKGAIIEETRGKTIWEGNNLRSAGEVELFSISCPSTFFSPGRFLLKIQKINPENAAVIQEFSFPFEIVASP